MDGLNKLIDAVENKIFELEGDTSIESTTDITASSEDLLKKIMNDPDFELGEPDESGYQSVFYDGEEIGTINVNKGICELDEQEEFSEEPINSSTIIVGADEISTHADLEQAIKDVLDPDLCGQIVELAFSNDNTFSDDVFLNSDTFFKTNLVDDDSKDIALKFFKGKDLDSRGPANPTREYLRLNGDGNIETTNDPDEIYFDILFDDIVQYILDHIEDLDFPEVIQDLIEEYLDTELEEE